MSLRPEQARWFELLARREDLTGALEALARTGCVELEIRGEIPTRLDLTDLRSRLEAFARLEQRYHAYWPPTDLALPATPGKPSDILDSALRTLHAWQAQAAPLIGQLESAAAEHAEAESLDALLRASGVEGLDLSLLAGSGPTLAGRVFVIPVGSTVAPAPGTVLYRRLGDGSREFILALGPASEMEVFGDELTAAKGRRLPLPADLPAGRAAALRQVQARLAALDARRAALHERLAALAERERLAWALTGIRRLEWFLTQVATLPVTENFAWVTGWSLDAGGALLRSALARAGINAIVGFPPTPGNAIPPMVMRNPWWARPFELFARTLGTPAADEADPSRLLAILVPLLFGYMFGDLGQGLVLFSAGVLLRKRWPMTRILIANGLAAAVFGGVFGSVFGREDIVPALWVHPMAAPLPVLLVPLGGGIVMLLLGLLLNAAEFRWRGRIVEWLQVEAAVVVLYLALLASLVVPACLACAALALPWYLAGQWLQSPDRGLVTLLNAIGALLESLFQLAVNTISFVRVGAFALAHGGLSLTFVSLAGSTEGVVAGFLIQLTGNLLVIMLEGLVVSIQTTRLILFEFFIRFLRCTGRMFRPLAAPAATTSIGREM